MHAIIRQGNMKRDLQEFIDKDTTAEEEDIFYEEFTSKYWLEDWFDDRKMEQILHQKPVQLKREAEYEQQSLFL